MYEEFDFWMLYVTSIFSSELRLFEWDDWCCTSGSKRVLNADEDKGRTRKSFISLILIIIVLEIASFKVFSLINSWEIYKLYDTEENTYKKMYRK